MYSVIYEESLSDFMKLTNNDKAEYNEYGDSYDYSNDDNLYGQDPYVDNAYMDDAYNSDYSDTDANKTLGSDSNQTCETNRSVRNNPSNEITDAECNAQIEDNGDEACVCSRIGHSGLGDLDYTTKICYTDKNGCPIQIQDVCQVRIINVEANCIK